jgi:ribosome-associated translation inhibitor RaiA
MTLPTQITYRHVEKSEAIERTVHVKAERLLRFAPDLIRCAVTIEAPHLQHHKGNVYQVRVHLTLPGGQVIVSGEPALDHAHEDLEVAIRDAFRAARRSLMDQVRLRRGDVKSHAGRMAP